MRLALLVPVSGTTRECRANKNPVSGPPTAAVGSSAYGLPHYFVFHNRNRSGILQQHLCVQRWSFRFKATYQHHHHHHHQYPRKYFHLVVQIENIP